MSADPSPDDKARYENLRRELAQALPKKRAVDKELAQIEVQIHTMEAAYLTETAAHSGGNIIQGFEGYLKNQTGTRRKLEVGDHDRVFSNSSLTFHKSLDLLGEGDESSVQDDYNKQTNLMVVLPPSAAQIKKHRDKEYQRKKRASASRASAGTVSDDDMASVISSSRRPSKRPRVDDD